MNAALIYQHTTSHADRAIAQALDREVRATRKKLSQPGQGSLFGGDPDAS